MTNPLAPTPDQDAAVRATRLYTLIRDAYLALPQITRRKLDALADLQLATARPAAQICSNSPRDSAICDEWSVRAGG